MKHYEYDKYHGLKYPIAAKMHINKAGILEMITAFKRRKCGSNKEIKRDTRINIICRGSSGAIIAAAFAMALPNETRIVYIRKDGERNDCHADMHEDLAPLAWASVHNVIIDDFIASGKTMNAIIEVLRKNKTKVHGIVTSGGVYHCPIEIGYYISGVYVG